MNYFLRLMTTTTIFTLLSAYGSNLIVPGEKTSSGENTLNSLVPTGWHTFEPSKDSPMLVTGDLNKDGIDDAAIVIEQESSQSEDAPRRALLIAFGEGNDSYKLSVIADKSILSADEGGIWGDPLDGIYIEKGTIVISFYGGSNDRWYAKYRFRFQDKDWYLIGATLGSYFTGSPDQVNQEDYNLLTGDYVIREADEQDPSKSKTTKGNRGKAALLRLKDFVADAGEDQFLK